MTTLATTPYSANVINMSFNDPGNPNGCSYTANSQSVDNRTRSHNLLAVVAAGNSPEGCAGNYVRSPGTAKNAIAVGSTDNYTIQWTNPDNPITTNTCAWNGFPPGTQDATRIPDYSAVWQRANVVKPDLVASSTRVTGPLARGAPGCASPLCNANIASFTNPDAVTYGMSAGTSFAAPVVAGPRLLALGLTGFLLGPPGSRGAGPYAFYALNPCRILATRLVPGVPLNSGTQYNYKVVGLCGVPLSAKAVFLNVAVVSPTVGTFFNVYPYPGPSPGTSTVNVNAGERALANGAVVSMGSDPAFQVSAIFGAGPGGTAHLVLDVMGYFQ